MLKETKNNNLIKLKGVLTSQIRTRESSNTPYYAFFRKADDNKHPLTQCIKNKCKDCEIPVIFRWKREFKDPDNQETLYNNFYSKPLLNKDDKVVLTGKWANSDHNSRSSFICFTYQLAND